MSKRALWTSLLAAAFGFAGGFLAILLQPPHGGEIGVAQRQAIERIATDIVGERLPDLLVAQSARVEAAFATARAEKEGQEIVRTAAALKTALAEFPSGAFPSIGDPSAARTIFVVEDLSCGFCRQMHPIVRRAIAAKPDTKAVFLPVGILGEASRLGAVAALALNAVAPAAAADFVDEIYTNHRQIDGAILAEVLISTLAKRNVPIDRYQSDGVPVGQGLFERLESAIRHAGVRGTPFFLFPDGTAAPGAMAETVFLDRMAR